MAMRLASRTTVFGRSQLVGQILTGGLALFAASQSASTLWGQANWTYTSNTIYAPAGTNVGIGGAPLLNFDVIGASGQSNLFRIRSDYSNPTFVFQNDQPSSFGGGSIAFRTSQGSFASPAAMGNNQLIGQMLFNGHDGSSYNTIASMIRSSVDGAVSTGVVPGRIQFFTAPPSGANGIREVMRLDANGYLGIGGVPSMKLDVIGGSGQTDLLRVRSDYSNPNLVLQNDMSSGYGGGTIAFRTSQGSFASPAAMSNNQLLGQMLFNGYDGSSYSTISSMIRSSVDGSVSAGVVPGRIQFFTAPSSGANGIREVMRITSNGNVGIGTTNPQNALSVNGVVQAKEVLVNTGWSDYVFAPNYPLRPLKEVAAFIQEHHHLPEIPTEAEVHQDGVSLGEMQAKLLAKIEELTLHMIQAEERNDQLEKQNQALQTRIARLEAQADAIVKPNTAK
jgi:hypothetical protein